MFTKAHHRPFTRQCQFSRTFPNYLFETTFSFIVQSPNRTQNFSDVTSKFMQEFLISLCVLLNRPCYLNFCRLNRSCWIIKVINLRIMFCSSAFRCSSSLLQTKRRLTTIITNAPNLCFSFKMEDNISYPYNRKLKILCINL